MTYHFVKHIGFDIEADSLEQAKEIANAIDDVTDIEDIAYDTMINAIDDVLDVGVLRDEFFDNCDAHAGNIEFVGVTETKGENDAEERFYDYLTDDDDVVYRLTDKGRDFLDFVEGKRDDFDVNDYDEHGNRVADEREVPDEFVDVVADAVAKAIITLLGI